MDIIFSQISDNAKLLVDRILDSVRRDDNYINIDGVSDSILGDVCFVLDNLSYDYSIFPTDTNTVIYVTKR